MKSTLSEFKYAGATHVGPVREGNQDAIRLADEHSVDGRGWLCAVAEAMGGYAQGGMASALALEELLRAFYTERLR